MSAALNAAVTCKLLLYDDRSALLVSGHDISEIHNLVMNEEMSLVHHQFVSVCSDGSDWFSGLKI